MGQDNIINQCSVVITRNCNLRCNFCYVKDAGYCTSEMVSLDNLKRIVDFCCDAKVVEILNTIYPLRKCNTYDKRECLYYHIGECLGYCTHEVEEEKRKAEERSTGTEG